MVDSTGNVVSSVEPGTVTGRVGGGTEQWVNTPRRVRSSSSAASHWVRAHPPVGKSTVGPS
jgi:hypothetical protein